jgi:hypothetical protein
MIEMLEIVCVATTLLKSIPVAWAIPAHVLSYKILKLNEKCENPLTIYIAIKHTHTVKPVLRGHIWDKEEMVL